MYINQHLSTNIGVKIFEMVHKSRVSTPFYQFLLVQKGHIHVYMASTATEYVLQENDIILIEPDGIFEGWPEPTISNVVLGFRIDKTTLHSLLPANAKPVCNSVIYSQGDYSKLNNIISRICSAYYSSDNTNILCSLIYELGDILTKNHCVINEHIIGQTKDLVQKRINDINEYIKNHYYHQLHLPALAEALYLTPQHLSKFIKEHMHTSFIKLLTETRLKHAKEALISSDASITSVAMNNGFPNITAFNKAFREKYDITPAAYRQKQIVAQRDQLSNAPSNAFKDISYDTAHKSIVLTTDKGIPYTPSWMDTINIGPLSNALNISFHDSFKENCRHLKICYVRFENIFDHDIFYKDSSSQTFNFTNLTVVLDYFYELNIIPFIELAYKPPKNQRSEKTFWSSLIDEKDSYDIDYCCEALDALLRHCLNQYGYSYVSSWRFEYWLKQNSLLYTSDEQEIYVKNYKRLYKIVKNLVPECLFGGPGFNMCINTSLFEQCLSCFEDAGLSMDFFSLYGFGYKSLSPHSPEEASSLTAILSTNPNHIHDILQKYKKILHQSIFADIPVFITEFGSLLAPRNHITESVYQAAFLVRNMTALFEDAACIAYLNFQNTDNALPAYVHENHLPIGLIRADGIPAPAFYAYSFLSKLGKTLLSHDQNHILTRSSANTYQLILFNYVHFKDSFCFHPLPALDIKDTYQVFRHAEALNITFTCSSIPSGRYKVTRLTLNRSHGSILDNFLQTLSEGSTTTEELLSTIINLREDEIVYFKHTAIPKQDIYYTSYHDCLEITATLSPHEVRLYEFSKTS